MRTLKKNTSRNRIIFSIFLLFFFSHGAFAVSLDFSCPSNISVLSQFNCTAKIINCSGGIYNLKFYIYKNISGHRTSLADIWSGTKWQTSYWYSKIPFSCSKQKPVIMKLIKNFSGSSIGEFKLRINGTKKVVYNKIFNLKISNEILKTSETKTPLKNITENRSKNYSIKKINKKEKPNPSKISGEITLNTLKDPPNSKKYKSPPKNGKINSFFKNPSNAWNVFLIFSFFLVLFLMIKKGRKRRRIV